MLKDIRLANDFNAACLRCFNAAGARSLGENGEAHNPETQLMPNIFKVMISTERKLEVFGSDYPTPDGTCIRDYLHVTDLARDHLLNIEHMQKIMVFQSSIWAMAMASRYWT